MERTNKPPQRDIPPIIRHIFRAEKAHRRSERSDCTASCGVLAELERYPELRH